jgi:hypothetical protein
MKDYHDLILLVRGDVVDKKAAKAAIQATFKNRGTDLQLLSVSKDQLETLQKYWGLYLKAADEAAQGELDTDIQVNIDEINEYLINNRLVQE